VYRWAIHSPIQTPSIVTHTYYVTIYLLGVLGEGFLHAEVSNLYGLHIDAFLYRKQKYFQFGFNSSYLPNPSSRTMALGSTQPLTEMSTRNIPGGEGRRARKADNLTTICEPIVYKMWEPRRLTALWVSMARYRDSFTF
jgi:hypothetical protein